VSHAGVLRGMHLQLPPHDHAKLVYCVTGRVVDVVVDLRRERPDYGTFVSFELSAESANMIYVPSGCAHGFCVLEGPATLVYHVTSEYEAETDAPLFHHAILPCRLCVNSPVPLQSDVQRSDREAGDIQSDGRCFRSIAACAIRK
jgi:dTDP-4-dehydrorhamnose 3,5-epimerase